MSQSAAQYPSPAFYVLIVAAGAGTRLGGDIPKQYQYLNGKTLLRRSVDIFMDMQNLKSLRVAIDPAHRGLYEESVQGLNLEAPFAGGATRQETIAKALTAWTDLRDHDFILVHDAARPFADRKDILRLLECLAQNPAATLAAPVTDTLRRSENINEQALLHATVSRDGLKAILTPQGFHVGTLKKAHQAITAGTFTDDTQAVSALGVDVICIESSRNNIKITTEHDWTLAMQLTSSEMETRIGSGFDVHAFDHDDPDRALMLCGIHIPHATGLKGHSDADVALHAITDALLGALAEGDIGTHFPPSNPEFKNMDSTVFLQKANGLLQARHGRILNIDLTIICEEPKIGPHRAAMQTRLSGLLNIPASRISIKATTTEGLGFTGRKEGIAAQAAICIELPREYSC